MRRNTGLALVAGALALLALFAAPLLAFALGVDGMGGGTWGMPMDGWTWGGPMHDGTGSVPVWFALVGVGSQIAVFVLLGVGAYLLYRAIAGDRTDPALDELRAAYARGDIDDDEYERRKDRLQNDN